MDSVDIKVILLGEVNAGKTSIFMRFFENTWNKQYHKSTIGFSYKHQEMTASNGSKFVMGVWDTAGSERYAALSTMYYRDADCAILCLDPSSDRSWEKVQYWTEEVKKVVPDCGIYVCATKKDLIDEGIMPFKVNLETLENFIRKAGASYIHVSSKSGQNIRELFQMVVDNCSRDLEFLDRLRSRRIENHSIIALSKTRAQISDKFIKSERCC